MWTVLRQAHGNDDQKQLAQALLVECYGPAIRNYLLALTKNHQTTDDLWQQFMVQLLEGGFEKVAPEKGRFRSYVKVCLFHLVAKEHRRRGRGAVTKSDAGFLAEIPGDANIDEPKFDSLWRNQLLDRAWDALRDAQPRYYQALRVRVDFPDDSVAELVERIVRGGEEDRHLQPINETAFRKLVSRARQRFANLLIDEVARSVDPPTLERVESELVDLELLSYCRSALDARAQAGA